MDSDPKTRRESKKTPKEKKASVYSSKRVRQFLAVSTATNKSKCKN